MIKIRKKGMTVDIHNKPPLPSRDPQLYGIMESLSIPENQYIANVIIDSTIIIAISIIADFIILIKNTFIFQK